MNKNKVIAAIDIGSSKIASLIAQVSVDQTTFESSISIVGVAASESKGIRKGQIVNIEEAVESIILSVEAAERMAGYNLDSAFISVGGGHISSQNSTGVVAVSDPNGEVSGDDVERVIEAARAISHAASREIIHVLPREYTVDGEGSVRDPVGMSGVRLEVETHLITASSAAIKNLGKAVAEVGVDIDDVIYSGLASSESTLSSTEKELGCVVIDIGGGTTSVSAYVDGAIAYSGTLPIGGKNVTNDLAIGLRLSLDSAEKIKLALSKNAGKEVPATGDQLDLSKLGAHEAKKVSKRTLVEGIIRPRMNEIYTMVKLDLERAGILNRIPSGAIITGGGALTIIAEDSAKRMLSLPVRMGVPKGVGGLIDDVINPSFSTAVGLILIASRDVSREGGMSFGKKMKIPGRGLATKMFDKIKDLLP